MAFRRSKIWLVPEDEFRRLVADAASRSDILVSLGFAVGSGGYRVLNDRIAELGLSTEHFAERSYEKRKSALLAASKPKRPIEELLVEGANNHSAGLKKKLIEEGILPNMCSECGALPEWNGKPLSLQLHHRNGRRGDDRKENLCLLCPNCRSQTPNFSGRGKRQETKRCACGTPIHKSSLRCRKCAGADLKHHHRKVEERPSSGVLLQEVSAANYEAVGRRYGVTGRTIKDWLIADGIEPPRKHKARVV